LLGMGTYSAVGSGMLGGTAAVAAAPGVVAAPATGMAAYAPQVAAAVALASLFD